MKSVPLPAVHALDARMRPGHDVRLFLDDAHAAWCAVVADLAAAQQTIAIQLYMWTPDAVGDAFLAALVAARGRGVTVRVTLDAFGSMGLPEPVVRALAEAGIALRWFGPLGLAVPLQRWRQRNHRKLFVIDGEIAWISGRNVGGHYYALAPGDATWADASVRVTGPLVADAVAALERDWSGRRGSRAVPAAPPGSEGLCALALHRGGLRRAEAERRYARAIRLAERSICLAQSYFLPTRAVLAGLEHAARQGRDVRVLVPDLASSDVQAVALASLHAAGRLLRARVRVRTLPGRMLHLKMGVVDGTWWTLGSTNLDPLSRLRNLEANVVGLGAEQALELTGYFDRLWQGATELDHAAWRNRPWWQRWLGAVAWRLKILL